MLLGEEVHTARKGDFVFVPKATLHARRTTSDSARLLHLCTPAGFERVLQMFGERTEVNAPPSSGRKSRAVDETRSQRLFEDLRLRPLNVKW